MSLDDVVAFDGDDRGICSGPQRCDLPSSPNGSSTAQQTIDQGVQKLLTIVAQHAHSLQREAAQEAHQHSEKIVAQLRVENANLRAELARNTLLVSNLRSAGDARPDALVAWVESDTYEKDRSVDVIDFDDNAAKGKETEALSATASSSLRVCKISKGRKSTPPRFLRYGMSSHSLQSGDSQLKEEVHDAKPKKSIHQPLFADAAVMKEQVRKAINKPTYSVNDFYWKTGYCQKIARCSWFESITLGMIFFNGLWIAVDSDHNKAPTLLQADPIFQVADHFFCAYFVFEFSVRFGAFRRKRDGLRDFWFVFDFVMACTMVVDTWLLTIVFVTFPGHGFHDAPGDTSFLKLIRLTRLTRIARMAKLLHAVPELMILIKGLIVAARSVCCTLVLLVVIIYIFALAFKQLSEGTELGEQRFHSVLQSMRTLFLDATLPDLAGIVSEAGEENLGYSVLLVMFILLGSLTVMNMLIGILVEVVSVVSAMENEQLQVNFVKTKLQTLTYSESESSSDRISRLEFERLLVRPEAAKIIQEVGVDVVGLVDFADVIFADADELSFGDFMTVILQFRGTNNATVRDIVELRKFMTHELQKVDKIHAQLQYNQSMYDRSTSNQCTKLD